jgi:hypothetical protein
MQKMPDIPQTRHKATKGRRLPDFAKGAKNNNVRDKTNPK